VTTEDLSLVLSPTRIGRVELRNRVVRTAYGTNLGRGQLNEDLIAHHEARARGGVGLSMVEATGIHPSGPMTLNGWDDSIVPRYAQLSRRVQDFGMKIFGQLNGRRVLVVGAGEISTLTAQHLRANGVGEILVTSRTPAHADALAASVNGRSVPWDDLAQGVAVADIVVTATGSQRPIITRAQIEAVTGRHRRDPLFIIDIAVPRDVEAAAGEIEQVFLYNIDDLQAAVRENLARRVSEVTRAEAIVEEELEKFGAWLRARGVIPTVVALRQSFESIRRAELDRLDFKLSALPPEAREEARARVDEITHLIVEKLLLMPTEQLKSLGDPETATLYAEAIARVFGLAEPAADEKDVQDGQDGDAHAERTAGRVQPFTRTKSRGRR